MNSKQKELADLVKLKVDMLKNKALSSDFKEFLSTNEGLITSREQSSLPQLSEKSKDKIKGLKKSDAIDKELSEYAVFGGRSRDGLLNRSSKDLAGDDSLFVKRLVLLFTSYIDQKKESLTSRKGEIATAQVERHEGAIKKTTEQRLKPKLSLMQKLGKLCGITPKPSTAHIEEADPAVDALMVELAEKQDRDLDERMGGVKVATAPSRSPVALEEAATPTTASLVDAVNSTTLSALETPEPSGEQITNFLDEVASESALDLAERMPAVPSGNLRSGGNDKGDGKGGGGGGGARVAVAIGVSSGLGNGVRK